jgi:hypothetical protein
MTMMTTMMTMTMTMMTIHHHHHEHHILIVILILILVIITAAICWRRAASSSGPCDWLSHLCADRVGAAWMERYGERATQAQIARYVSYTTKQAQVWW